MFPFIFFGKQCYQVRSSWQRKSKLIAGQSQCDWSKPVWLSECFTCRAWHFASTECSGTLYTSYCLPLRGNLNAASWEVRENSAVAPTWGKAALRAARVTCTRIPNSPGTTRGNTSPVNYLFWAWQENTGDKDRVMAGQVCNWCVHWNAVCRACWERCLSLCIYLFCSASLQLGLRLIETLSWTWKMGDTLEWQTQDGWNNKLWQGSGFGFLFSIEKECCCHCLVEGKKKLHLIITLNVFWAW